MLGLYVCDKNRWWGEPTRRAVTAVEWGLMQTVL